MATTPNGLPYPVGTDRVMDGDDAIRALALGVDNGTEVTTNITLLAAGGSGVATFRRRNGWIEIVLNTTGANVPTGSGGALIAAAGAIPANQRPANNQTAYGFGNGGGTTILWITVQADGSIGCAHVAASAVNVVRARCVYVPAGAA